MRIGIEAQRIFRAKKHGMDIVAINTIKALQKLDKINEYFIFTNEQDDIDCLEETSNFQIIRAPGYMYPVWEQIILPRLAERYYLDVLHCTSNTAPLDTEIPLVVTLHDIIYLENNPLKLKGTMYQKWGNFYRSQVVPSVIKNASKILTVSNFEKLRIAELMEINNGRLEALYNGVSEHFFNKANRVQINAVQIKYSLPKNYIFLLGNTDHKKNIPRTLKAYETYLEKAKNPLPLVIADFSRENLLLEVKENGISTETLTHIHLIGYVPNTDLPAVYQLSSLFLYTSTRESFGIPILEAMASGVPVVTSKTAAMPEVAGMSAALANPYDSQDIADKMLRVLENETLKENLKARGYNRVQKFRWEKTAEKLMEVYQTFNIKIEEYWLVA